MATVKKYRSQKLITRSYPNPASGFKGNNFEVNNWIISEFVSRELAPIVDIHPYPLQELSMLTAIVCWFNPDSIFEWGTHLGKSARIFYEIISKFRLQAKIYTVDLPETAVQAELPPKDQIGYFFKDIPEITQLFGDGLTESLKITRKMSNASRALYFLDGDHSYESVLRELKALGNLKKQVCIVVHDTFYQTPESEYNIGPYKAINDFLRISKRQYKVLKTELGLPGMTVLL